MKRRITWMTLLSAASFGYNVKAVDFYTETELAPAVSFISVSGNPLTIAPYTTGPNAASLQQEIGFLGGGARQSFGYGKWLTLDTSLAFGLSLGGTGTTTFNSVPSRGSFFDAAGEFYISLPLRRDETVLLEPMLGFSYLLLDTQNMLDGGQYGRMNDALAINAFGPMGGLFARLYILENFSMRFGTAYQISQMRTDSYNSYGTLAGKPSYRARRHGMLGRLRFDYKASDFVSFMLGFDVQSWSAGGGTVYPYPYGSLVAPITLQIARTRISWGVNFNY